VLCFLFVFALSGKVFSPSSSVAPKPGEHSVPIKSFVKIETVVELTVTGCNEGVSEEIDCTPRTEKESPNMASGVVIEGNRVVTAGHVCMSMVSSEMQAAMFELLELNAVGQPNGSVKTTTHAIDFDGKLHDVEILAMTAPTDLCVLSVPTIDANPVAIADTMPPQSSRVYNVAAPHGMFAPGMSLMFEGLYAGDDWDGDTWFTFPAAPGSSGSPIFNDRGELIGIVTMASPEFEHIAIGSDVEKVKQFLDSLSLD
jgi:S1-C subfamily serine protease